jgi:hypothetical protein
MGRARRRVRVAPTNDTRNETNRGAEKVASLSGRDVIWRKCDFTGGMQAPRKGCGAVDPDLLCLHPS